MPSTFVPVRLVFFNESYYSTLLEITVLYVLSTYDVALLFSPNIIHLIASLSSILSLSIHFCSLSLFFSSGRAGKSADQYGVVTESAGVFWHECGLQVQSIA